MARVTNTYVPLPLYRLEQPLAYCRPRQAMPSQVTMDSPAAFVMTDLRQVTAVTVEAGVSIDYALNYMKEQGVRLLLVVGPGGHVIGLVTARDIQGERPMQVLKEIGGRHEELRVRDIFTPFENVDFMTLEDVLKATVGDVVATLQRVGRQHALVMGGDPESEQQVVRGIFSVTQISRQLGVPIETVEVATTFAEMETALNS